MDINITGNPGTGNTFQEIHIGSVQNYNPNATTVINYNYGDQPKPASAATDTLSDADREQRKAEILAYVGRLKDRVSRDWKNRYETLWHRILSLPEVEAAVYEPGKQKNTTFNRNLVANIIYIMCSHGVFDKTTATELTIALEGDKERSVRAKLGEQPDDKALCQAVEAVLQA